MRRASIGSVLCGVGIIAVLGAVSPAAGVHHGADRQRAIDSAVAHPERPEKARARDADRKPAVILEFFGIAPGPPK
jgi:predicted methyltransferase